MTFNKTLGLMASPEPDFARGFCVLPARFAVKPGKRSSVHPSLRKNARALDHDVKKILHEKSLNCVALFIFNRGWKYIFCRRI